MRPPLSPIRLAYPATPQASAIPRCCCRLRPCHSPSRSSAAQPPARRLFSTTPLRCADSTANERPTKKPSGRRPGTWTAAAVFIVGGAAYWATAGASSAARPPDDGSSSHRAGNSLNRDTFVPFEVVARETVSPTAFVLTLRLPRSATPASRAATRRLIDEAWQHGLWSVEVKQPQLQIARDYTPLPEVDQSQSENDDVQLRIFVRTVPGGEVSRYLSQRAVGTTIDVRGPRLSFDVASRLRARDSREQPASESDKVVILAAGTGIATALQAAAAVLRALPAGSLPPATTILWANRLAQDSVGLERTDGSDGDGEDVSLANPVVRDLKALQARYGADRLRMLSYVDAQQRFITERDVREVVSGNGGRSWLGVLWPFGSSGSSTPPPLPQPSATAPTCVYHSKFLLQQLEADPEYGSARALCLCDDTPSSGSGMVLVSGPDGFVSAWAGPKTWAAGRERQGPVGGILGKLAAKDSRLAEWQVLKL